jgi:hypothetical protein
MLKQIKKAIAAKQKELEDATKREAQYFGSSINPYPRVIQSREELKSLFRSSEIDVELNELYRQQARLGA